MARTATYFLYQVKISFFSKMSEIFVASEKTFNLHLWIVWCSKIHETHIKSLSFTPQVCGMLPIKHWNHYFLDKVAKWFPIEPSMFSTEILCPTLSWKKVCHNKIKMHMQPFLFCKIPLGRGHLPPTLYLSPCAIPSSQCHYHEFWEFFWLRDYSSSLWLSGQNLARSLSHPCAAPLPLPAGALSCTI